MPTSELPGWIANRLKFQQHLTGQVSRASTDVPRCSPAALLAPLHRGRLLPASLVQLQCLWGLWGKPQGQKLTKGRPCVFAALACPVLWSARWDHRSSCLPHPCPPCCPSTEEACRCNIESSIISMKYFPLLAKHRPYHQDPKHPAPVPAPAAEVHTRFQLCRILSRAYQDRETREMGDAHPVLLHLLGLARPGFPPTHPPSTTSLWMPDEDGERGAPGIAAEMVLCLLSAMMGGFPHTSRKSCFCKGCFY